MFGVGAMNTMTEVDGGGEIPQKEHGRNIRRRGAVLEGKVQHLLFSNGEEEEMNTKFVKSPLNILNDPEDPFSDDPICLLLLLLGRIPLLFL